MKPRLTKDNDVPICQDNSKKKGKINLDLSVSECLKEVFCLKIFFRARLNHATE